MALACMVIYAFMSAMAVGMISPFMQVLFERVGQESAQAVAAPGAETLSPTLALAREPLRLDHLARWPAQMRARAQRSLILARPLVALERI